MSLEDKLYPVLKIYEACPQWMKNLAGLAYRFIPSKIRYGKVYPAFQELIDNGYSWDKEEIEAYQFEQLKRSLTEAWNHCPFYKRTFEEVGVSLDDFKSLSDIKKFPMITKQDLLDHEKEIASSRLTNSERLRITTGGSTGVPVGFYLQKGVSRSKEQAFLEGMWMRSGYDVKSKVAVVRGHVTSKFSDGKVSYYDATRNWLVLSSYHLTEERIDEYIDSLNKFKPEYLHFYPSAALAIAEIFKKAGKSLGFKPKGMLCGSERLELPQKRILEKSFGCKVYRWYGHAERIVLAGEGSDSENFYFWPTYGYAELGEADENGYREVIGTSFHNMAMPFIRYRTGDYVMPVDDADEIEYPWLAVKAVAGREQEFLVTRTGRKISLTAFNMHDGIFDGLYAVQFFQEKRGEAEFRYVAMDTFDVARLAIIEDGIRNKLGDDFLVKLVEVNETEKTPAGKHRWLISNL